MEETINSGTFMSDLKKLLKPEWLMPKALTTVVKINYADNIKYTFLINPILVLEAFISKYS